MTLQELNERYTASNWLIAKRSATAAGKALFFSEQSLEEVTREIAALYGLHEQECAQLSSGHTLSGLGKVQEMAKICFLRQR